ncbi:MAG TPA: hypothetical protein VJK09_00240 [Candidatus Paceibacterota bacterium]
MEEETDIANTAPRSHIRMIIFVIMLVVIALLFWQGAKSVGMTDYERAAAVPSQNQGVVTADEKASIEALRQAPPSTQ